MKVERAGGNSGYPVELQGRVGLRYPRVVRKG